MQKVLIISTERPQLRAATVGWSAEDGDNVLLSFQNVVHGKVKNFSREFPATQNEMMVGQIASYRGSYSYPTVLHALGDGWNLLAPPKEYSWENGQGSKVTEWEWWLVKS